MFVRTTTHLRVLFASIAAVVVCAAILGVLQYRSLVQLEARTRITFQDELVRSAQTVAESVEADVLTAGVAALGSFRSEDTAHYVRELAARFQELLRSRPEIDEVFLFALDDPAGTSAVFSTPDGTDRCNLKRAGSSASSGGAHGILNVPAVPRLERSPHRPVCRPRRDANPSVSSARGRRAAGHQAFRRRDVQPLLRRERPSEKVAVQIAERGAPVQSLAAQDLQVKCAVALVQKNAIRLAGMAAGGQLDIIHHVAVRREDVFESVVVEVKHARAPAGPWQALGADAAGVRHIGEVQKIQIAIERIGLVRQRS